MFKETITNTVISTDSSWNSDNRFLVPDIQIIEKSWLLQSVLTHRSLLQQSFPQHHWKALSTSSSCICKMYLLLKPGRHTLMRKGKAGRDARTCLQVQAVVLSFCCRVLSRTFLDHFQVEICFPLSDMLLFPQHAARIITLARNCQYITTRLISFYLLLSHLSAECSAWLKAQRA